MECNKVSTSVEQLLDPFAGAWESVPAEDLEMAGTPLANQPSEYVKASRDENNVGKVHALKVQTVHNGSEIIFRLSWSDDTDNTAAASNVFPDACGILMPIIGEPPIEEMGSEEAPVNAWFWRANYKDDFAQNTVARGLGTTVFTENSPIRARGSWREDAWAVTFARPLAVPALADEATQLVAGGSVKIGFAVWEGSNGERAGVKSFSKEWREMVLTA